MRGKFLNAMRNLSYGFDPAPPGKYPITQIVIDSDLDGIMCGAMLHIVYPEAKLITADATSMQMGKFNDIVNKNTAIADLKYIEGCGLYLDHHISNKPAHNDFPGRWRNTDSAARVVYDYFRKDYDLSTFAVIIDDIDRFDMGHITKKDIVNPNELFELGMSINRDDADFNHYLINELAHKKWKEVIKDGRLQNLFRENEDSRGSVLEYIKEHSLLEQNIAFINMSTFRDKVRVSSYLYTVPFSKADAVCVFKFAKSDEGFNVRLYHNNFNPDSFDFDLLKVARAINKDMSGGHKKSCGFMPRAGQTIENVISEVLKELKKQH
jgi:oligoribonuclease NrnB/cAMP/cGMP phosphodiesterase (DHH superfamily)